MVCQSLPCQMASPTPALRRRGGSPSILKNWRVPAKFWCLILKRMVRRDGRVKEEGGMISLMPTSSSPHRPLSNQWPLSHQDEDQSPIHHLGQSDLTRFSLLICCQNSSATIKLQSLPPSCQTFGPTVCICYRRKISFFRDRRYLWRLQIWQGHFLNFRSVQTNLTIYLVFKGNNKNNSHEGARPRTPSQPNNLSQWRKALSHSGSHTSSESVSIFLLTLLTRSGFPASNCCLWKLNRVSHDTHKFVLQT